MDVLQLHHALELLRVTSCIVFGKEKVSSKLMEGCSIVRSSSVCSGRLLTLFISELVNRPCESGVDYREPKGGKVMEGPSLALGELSRHKRDGQAANTWKIHQYTVGAQRDTILP